MRRAILGIIVLGVLFRCVHLLLIDPSLPNGGGGLFLEFAQSIARNSYRLPAHIDFYTPGGIPYAYPPLAFYIEALVLNLPVSPYLVANVLPAVMACVSLPVFYQLAAETLETPRQRGIGLMVFATLPAAWESYIAGEGLAESVGIVVLMAYMAVLWRILQTPLEKKTGWAGVLLGMCVLASPGSAYAAVLLSLVMAAHSRRQWPKLMRVALIGLIVSCPYWLPVMWYHGPAQFVVPFESQHSDLVVMNLQKILIFYPAGGIFGLIWNGLIALGMFSAWYHRRGMITVWFVLLFLIPRESEWLVAFPAALLVALAVDDVLTRWQMLPRRSSAVPMSLVLLYVMAGGLLMIMQLSDFQKMTRDQFAALTWIHDHTDSDTALIVLAERTVTEWSPQITRRTVLNVGYGAEWEPDELEIIQDFNEAAWDCKDLACVQELSSGAFQAEKIMLVMDRHHYSEEWDEETPVIEANGLVIAWLKPRQSGS
jgi:hypothetical protein